MKPMQTQHTGYEIRVAGHLPPQWADWFDGLAITLEPDGTTRITGPLIDQAALHGLLKKIRDLGLPLISVAQVKIKKLRNNFLPGERMETTTNSLKKIDTRTLLSILWVVVMINMLMADILSLFIPGTTEEVARTSVSTGIPIPILMLSGAVIGNLAIAMIILSRVLNYRLNRWTNIVMSILIIVYIWGGMSATPHYLFIAGVESLCLLLVIWNSWKWSNPENQPANQFVREN